MSSFQIMFQRSMYKSERSGLWKFLRNFHLQFLQAKYVLFLKKNKTFLMYICTLWFLIHLWQTSNEVCLYYKVNLVVLLLEGSRQLVYKGWTYDSTIAVSIVTKLIYAVSMGKIFIPVALFHSHVNGDLWGNLSCRSIAMTAAMRRDYLWWR